MSTEEEPSKVSSGTFVQLADDGDQAVGVLTGMPFVHEVVWSKENGYETYSPKEHAGRRPRMRVAMNFFDLADGTMRIIEGGARWWKNVRAIRAELPFDRWAFEIVRHGGPSDPRTRYSIQPYARLGTSLRMRIATTPVHDLEKILGVAHPMVAVRVGNPPVDETSKQAVLEASDAEIVRAAIQWEALRRSFWAESDGKGAPPSRAQFRQAEDVLVAMIRLRSRGGL